MSIPPQKPREQGDAGSAGRFSATEPRLVGDVVAVPRLELAVEREAGQPVQRQVVLDGDFFRIGSHPGNNLVLADKLISRFHCSITRDGAGWRLNDIS